MTDYTDWLGRSETRVDRLDPQRSNALRAALGNETPLADGDALPLLHHWLYFWDVKAPAALGEDGHPRKGGFLPAVSLPRRMWAGGRVVFHGTLRLGDDVTKVSTILKVEAKSGKSGDLVFVTVEHALSSGGRLTITDEQDIVYRGAAAAGSIPAPADDASKPAAAWCEPLVPDTVLLQRYSALTMNGHRIHYDRPYAMAVEAYPGLVVHGPLQATLLADLGARHLGKPVTRFAYRGQAPAFDGALLHVCGEPSDGGADLWTSQGGVKNMVATIA